MRTRHRGSVPLIARIPPRASLFSPSGNADWESAGETKKVSVKPKCHKKSGQGKKILKTALLLLLVLLLTLMDLIVWLIFQTFLGLVAKIVQKF